MKKLLFLTITILAIGLSNVNAEELKLTDVENHWAKESIERMVINDKLSGYPDKTFKPDNDISILEFIKIMIDNLDIQIAEEGLNRWPDYYINTARKYNLNYEFNKKATRYEAVEIIAKLMDLKNVSQSKKCFKDIEEKYKTNVSKLVKLNIINGYEDGEFKGNNNLTRAEAVTIVVRVLEANQKIIEEKKYELDNKYTNLDSENNGIWYKVLDNKIYFFDNGRFSDLQNYTIDEKYITNKKLIGIIKCLISEDSYTALYYVPSKYIINQIIIKHAKNAEDASKNLEYFSFTYYEDKLYDLGRATLKDFLSNECYMKISIKKMWKEQYEFQKGNFTDENIREKLYKALQIEFGKSADDILKYMLDIYEDNIVNKNNIVKQIKFDKYLINVYKTDSTNLEFYIEKK